MITNNVHRQVTVTQHYTVYYNRTVIAKVVTLPCSKMVLGPLFAEKFLLPYLNVYGNNCIPSKDQFKRVQKSSKELIPVVRVSKTQPTFSRGNTPLFA